MATHSIKSLIAMAILCIYGCSPQSTPDNKASSYSNTVRISAVGDIMLGGTAEPVMQQHGYDYPFEKVKHLFNGSNIVIGNLEGPLTNVETVLSDKEYLFKTPPKQVAPALKKAGFNIMNLANNHIMDYGVAGMTDTINALRAQNIHTVGTGMNLQEARRGTILHSNNHKIGFVSYSLTFPESFWATDDRPGSAFGHEHQIRNDVKRLKDQCDLVIVSFHWGHEKASELRDYQPILAHAAIDEGADMVIGHHPHVLQAVEQYKQGIILYSLGNFTFGSYSRSADVSVVATAIFKNKQFHSLELTPINVLNIEVNFQPQILLGEAADKSIAHIKQLSRSRNTQITRQNNMAYVEYPANQIKSISK
ncbi:MAG: CapA family protein [Gammaproteobacteria bacterium]|nr:CapA family protein [Gammaproteobacteria bacterium]